MRRAMRDLCGGLLVVALGMVSMGGCGVEGSDDDARDAAAAAGGGGGSSGGGTGGGGSGGGGSGGGGTGGGGAPGDGSNGPTVTYPMSGHPLNWLTTDTTVIAKEDEVLSLVNSLRASVGAGALTMNLTMRRCARGHSKHMTAASHAFFDHVNPEGDDPTDRWIANGGTGGAGENIAAGYATASAAVDGWIGSPPHYANMTNGSYTTTGIGYQSGASYGHYWTQMFK